MAGISTNMGLVIWDLPDDDFTRTELANNWAKVDSHDHSAGHGKRLSDESLEDGAVTGPKIQDGAVSSSKLAANSVNSTAIINGAVTVGKIGDAAVVTAKIQDGAVQTAKIGDSQVTGVKVANASLTGAKLIDGTIGTTQMADSAINATKLASNAVTTTKITDLNVTKNKMADCAVDDRVLCDGAVTAAKLDPDVVPIGQVIQWWRPDDTVGLPGGGWEVADGATITAINHDFPVAGSIVLPDLRNRFILGAVTSGGGAGTGTAPNIGLIGSAHTKDLSHAHTIAHTHTVNSHTHGYGFGDHTHRFIDPLNPGDPPVHFHQRGSGVKLRADDLDTTWRQGAYLPGINSAFAPNTTHDSGPIEMEQAGGQLANTSAVSPGTSASSAANSGTAGSASQDIRPAYVGLLFLIKVRSG